MRLRRKFHCLNYARAAAATILALSLSGCIVASAVTTIVLLPVKIVGAGIDAIVTTKAEADEKRGRKQREAEENAEKARKKAAKAEAKAAKDAAKTSKPG